ncbi:hypothetical protein [uncultured Parasphingopyxis sp.]|uniref:hypothetical protein n=1 Tax=uncultured Parasphingopyxis sp. TaxID=1547918 RepID=UPI002613CAAE|nr:hypothetical protein [uncultured Parasphingopyxis sp.]
MKKSWAMLAVLPLAIACTEANGDGADGENTESEATETAEADAEPLVLDSELPDGGMLVQATGGDDAAFDPDCVIGEDRIAGVRIPATLGAFAESFPASTALRFESAYMVDFGALCALSGGEDAICAFFESYDVEEYSPDVEVIGMATYAQQCRTEAGVGPGTSIETAVAAYGDASFGFNYSNEGREGVSFPNAPQNFSFRADSPASETPPAEGNWPNGPFGGDYSDVEGDGEYFETATAMPGATIWEVWINSARSTGM